MSYKNINSNVEADKLPNPLITQKGIIHNPNAQMHTDAGWRSVIPADPAPEGYVRTTRSTVYDPNTDTVQEVYDLITEEENQQNIKNELKQTYINNFTSLAPILDDHPQEEDIPAGGMFYRLHNSEDPNIIELWFIRESDLISTQLSAHDSAGLPILRYVNIKTKKDVTIKLEEMIKGLPKESQDSSKIENDYSPKNIKPIEKDK